uniref:Uncharacterized protein n=1 Tax=Oryza rufipogon TaxID=4529 RepID=A0A0E0N3J6_ORYRU
MLPGDPSSSLLCRFRLPRRPSRLTASEERCLDGARKELVVICWVDVINEARISCPVWLHQAVTEATRPLFQATETITQITLTGQTAGISINIKDKNRWLNNHFNSRRALDFSVASIC